MNRLEVDTRILVHAAALRLPVALVVAILFGLPTSARAAAPEYVWVAVDANNLVLLSDFDDNALLISGGGSDELPQPSRRRFELYLFWGIDWRLNPEKHREVLDGNVEMADQRGYFYPASGALPATLVLELPSGDFSAVILSDEALSLLEEAGVPVRVDAAEGGWAGWNGPTMAAAGVVAFAICAIFVTARWLLRRR